MSKTNKYLWKYMSLDKFESLLENQGLYFSSLAQLRKALDPVDGEIIELHTKNIIEQLEKTKKGYDLLLNIGNDKSEQINEVICKINDNINNTKQICESLYKNTFICSFTEDSVENYALWKIYPTNLRGELQVNQGIAIKIKENHLLKILEQPSFVFDDGTALNNYRGVLREVDYQPISSFLKIATSEQMSSNCRDFYRSIHCTKSEHYKYEKEKRAIFQFFDENKNNSNGGILKINLKEFFSDFESTSIFISPFASKHITDYVYFLLNKHELNADELISKSEVITCK